MPSSADHKRQAVDNQTAYTVIYGRGLGPDLPDWEITTTFYTAVHEIRCYFSRRDVVLTKRDLFYDDFDSILRGYGEDDLADTFDQLKKFARGARYWCMGTVWCRDKAGPARDALGQIQRRLRALHVQLDQQGVP